MNLRKSEFYFDIYQELSHVVRETRLEQGHLQSQKKGHASLYPMYSYKKTIHRWHFSRIPIRNIYTIS